MTKKMRFFKALVTDNVSDLALEEFRTAGMKADRMRTMAEDELMRIIPDYDAVIVRSSTKVTRKVIEAGAKLKVIGRAGAGVDNIDLNAAAEKGIAVLNTPHGNINAAAEHTIALMMALARNLHHAHVHLEKGGWEREKYIGVEIKGKILGIIGLGRIGRLVGEKALGLGMKVLSYDPGARAGLGIERAGLKELITKADFITLHVPLTDKTKHLLDEPQFLQMKNGVRIINAARGGVINEEALFNAIKTGKVAGAAIDVWETEPPWGSKLLSMEEVLSTPHIGASTREAQVNVAVGIAQLVIKYLNKVHG